MKKTILTTLFCISIVFMPNLQADKVTKTEMLENLVAMKGFLRCKYGPIHWKKEYANWELEREIDHAKARIESMNKISVKDFQEVYRDLFASLKDYHVSAHFYSSECAFLPFELKKIKGRYLVTSINRKHLPQGKYPFCIGDEITHFNGKPIEEAVGELRALLGDNVEETDQCFAESFLTMRLGRQGFQVPKGKGVVEFGNAKHANVGGRKFAIEWIYTPEVVKRPEVDLLNKSYARDLPRIQNPEKLNQLFSIPVKSVMDEVAGFKEPSHENPNALGEKKSFLPYLGEVVWETEEEIPFHAYIYLNQQGKKIGYLRIPHYMFTEEDANELVKIIKQFENETEALVFDQINNTGGNVFFAYGLTSLLANKPIRCFKQSVVLTQEEFMEACVEYAALNDIYKEIPSGRNYINIYGFMANKSAIKEIMDYDQFIIKQWTAGKFYSDNYYMWGLSKIMPHPETHYTKPILMLISSLDFSCGDIVPAYMQDSQRAILMGTRTAGAGGFVIQFKYPNRLGIQKFSLTGSLIRRYDGNPIENLGIQPDIPYELSENDIKFGYREYVDLINQTIDQM